MPICIYCNKKALKEALEIPYYPKKGKIWLCESCYKIYLVLFPNAKIPSELTELPVYVVCSQCSDRICDKCGCKKCNGTGRLPCYKCCSYNPKCIRCQNSYCLPCWGRGQFENKIYH